MLTKSRMELRGCAFNVHSGGDGQPVLILHGVGGIDNIRNFAESLCSSCRVFLPEHPGFDDSTDPAWLESMADLAYFYLDFIKSNDLCGVHLLGHSFGGWLASELAVRSTESLSSLTLIASAGIRVKDTPPGDSFLWSPEEAAERLYFQERYRETARHPRSVEAQLAQMKNVRSAAKLGWHPRWYNPGLARWLDRIDVPTSIIWGSGDGLFPVAYAQEFGRLIPQAKVHILEQSGHSPHVEQADEVRNLILAHLEEAA